MASSEPFKMKATGRNFRNVPLIENVKPILYVKTKSYIKKNLDSTYLHV